MKEGHFQFLKMSPEEAEAYLREHVAAADRVITRFRDRLVAIAGLSPDVFDYSENGLEAIWEAVKPLYAERERDRYGFGDDEPPLWFHPEDPASNQLPHHLWWIRDGLIHYVSRCWMALSPRLRWDWERDQETMGANQPVLIGGFDGRIVGPIGVISAMASSFLIREDRFMGMYRNYAQKAPIAGDAAVGDQYDPREVEVSMANGDEISLEIIHPDHPEAWVGTWSVWLPEGVDVVCGEGTVEALEDVLRSRPDVSRVGYANEDVLLVDAPALTAGELQRFTIDFLNARR